MKKEVIKFQVRNREIQDEMAAIYDKQAIEMRELTAEESAKLSNLKNEFESNCREILMSKNEETIGQMRESENKNVRFREFLKGVKEGRENATTILLNPVTTGTDRNTVKNITESGAIPLTIQDVLDTKVEGIGLPPGTNLLTGVVGDVLWPVSADDVVVSVAGEVAQIEEQALSFTNIKAHSERLTASVAVSNKAIYNAAFDLYAFVTAKIRKGLAIKLAKRVYGHKTATDEFKGPFARCTVQNITKDENFAKNLAIAVAEIADQGFEGEPVIVIDKVTEAELKYTPANNFAGNTDAVIKDGKLAGYNYVTSGKINLGGAQGERFIGIGYFEYLALQQHGDVLFTVDATSAQVSGRNSTVFTLNTDFSATELSSVINGQSTTEGEPKAFKLFKIVTAQPEPEPEPGS